MNNIIVCGIDPGTKGCTVFLEYINNTLNILELNTHKKYTDLSFKDSLLLYKPQNIMVEHVWGRPTLHNGKFVRSGIKQAFVLGQETQRIYTTLTLLEFEYTKVIPTVWMNYLNCKTGGNKHISKDKVESILSPQKTNHNSIVRHPLLTNNNHYRITLENSDAILIAYYSYLIFASKEYFKKNKRHDNGQQTKNKNLTLRRP